MTEVLVSPFGTDYPDPGEQPLGAFITDPRSNRELFTSEGETAKLREAGILGKVVKVIKEEYVPGAVIERSVRAGLQQRETTGRGARRKMMLAVTYDLIPPGVTMQELPEGLSLFPVNLEPAVVGTDKQPEIVNTVVFGGMEWPGPSVILTPGESRVVLHMAQQNRRPRLLIPPPRLLSS